MSEYKIRNNYIIDTSNPGKMSDSSIDFVKNVDIHAFLLLLANIVLVIYVAVILILHVNFKSMMDKKITRINPAGLGENIEINNMNELDGTSRKEIDYLRKRYINRSMFKSNDYEPNEGVFGGIQDGKYWYGTENLICYNKEESPLLRAVGDSYVSRLINNPSMLIGLDLPYVWNLKNPKDYKVCTDKKMLFFPESITYSKEYNMITTIFHVDDVVTGKKLKYMFTGLNARDLGFKWGYVFNTKNITFANKDIAIDKELYEFRDYISVGSSCGIEGGCNNLCPMQESLMFYFYDKTSHRFRGNNAVIDFKLWKNKPLCVASKPDLYYRIIFEYR